jgi:hypothetical protein
MYLIGIKDPEVEWSGFQQQPFNYRTICLDFEWLKKIVAKNFF